MIELPEAGSIARQLNKTIAGKRILNVVAAQHPHKFAWYYGDPQSYHKLLQDKVIDKAVNYGGLIEISAGDASILLGDGVNLGYFQEGAKLLARRVGFEPYGITCSTPISVRANCYIREYFAFIKSFLIDKVLVPRKAVWKIQLSILLAVHYLTTYPMSTPKI